MDHQINTCYYLCYVVYFVNLLVYSYFLTSI